MRDAIAAQRGHRLCPAPRPGRRGRGLHVRGSDQACRLIGQGLDDGPSGIGEPGPVGGGGTLSSRDVDQKADEPAQSVRLGLVTEDQADVLRRIVVVPDCVVDDRVDRFNEIRPSRVLALGRQLRDVGREEVEPALEILRRRLRRGGVPYFMHPGEWSWGVDHADPRLPPTRPAHRRRRPRLALN